MVGLSANSKQVGGLGEGASQGTGTMNSRFYFVFIRVSFTSAMGKPAKLGSHFCEPILLVS